MELKGICRYVPERVATTILTTDNYISTENMLPDKGGVVVASGVPTGNAVAFAKGDVLVSNIRPYFKKDMASRQERRLFSRCALLSYK